MNGKIQKIEKEITFGENRIYAEEYIPENKGEKLPAVILSHGYNSCCGALSDMAERFAQSGVYACCFDFCGGSTYSKSSGKSTEMSIETEKRDLSEVIKAAEALSFTDKIYLYGESQGGFVSALTAADIPDKISGMFLIYPAFCIPDDWLCRSAEEFLQPSDFMGMTLSKVFYDGVPRYDVYQRVSAFKNKVLIFHGDSDGLVDISYSRRLEKSFSDCELTVIKGEGHGFAEGTRKRIAEMILKEIKK